MAEADFTLPPTLNISITPVVACNYERRGVFPSLRLAHAVKVVNGATGIYRVSLDEAREIHRDAEEQRQNRELPRGLPAAFTALARNLHKAIRNEERRGLWEDPGLAEAAQRMTGENPARFKVGEAAMLEDGTIVEIVGDYKLWCVRSQNGVYMDKEGDRIDYKFGYLARAPGRERFFFSPCDLFEPDGSVRYLKLVA